ncbi:MAG: putative Flagellin, Flp1-like, domain [Pseudomonadota bacterium]
MKALKNIYNKLQLNKFLKEESAQGMTEYILLIVVVVTLAYAFRNKISSAINTKMGEVDSGIQGFEIQK